MTHVLPAKTTFEAVLKKPGFSPPDVLFSYKQNMGHGGNHKVARVKTALGNKGFFFNDVVEQQHQFEIGTVGGKEEWWKYWKYCAENCRYVVCFDDDDYMGSEPCRKELSWCGRNKTGAYICVGGLMNKGLTAEAIADEIYERANEK